MTYLKEFENWTTNPVFDQQTKNELLSITDQKEIEDRFYKSLSFGTGGMRGVIGAGINRMNVYTVGKASQGLANFINKTVKNGSVVIAYDSRRMSPEFALRTALVMCANGIKAYLFTSLRPTPELSFAVRYLGATAGVCITASHNPPEYNGYKVYWSDGGQIVPPYDTQIISEVNAISDFNDVKCITEEQALSSGLLNYVDSQVDDAYVAELKKLVLNPDVIKKTSKDIKIVYTPLNGAGNMPVRRVLKELGFENVWVVPEQEAPDGNFPTLEYPNPEDPKAFTYALELAKKVDADVVLATDPDADRLGVFAKDSVSGEYKMFTGNMSGLLIAEYQISQKKEKGLLPKNTFDGALITTVVSSDMAYAMAKEYGLTVIEVLTGFKYIGEQIKLFEQAKESNGGVIDGSKGAYEYLFGYEESYGCLVGTHARDKDAVVAVLALAEATAHYKTLGMTLCDQMQSMYKKYGYYMETIHTAVYKGADGAEKISAIINKLRNEPKDVIGGEKVIAVRDYKTGLRTILATGETTKLTLPNSNVLYYEFSDAWCCVRPSGTEPKIKFYFGVKEADELSAKEKLSKLRSGFLEITE